MPPPAEGLTQAEARRRLAARGEVEPPPTSRSWSSILRANLLTVFNVTLLIFGIVTLIFGDWRDALFLGILVLNAGIGIIQEARAKASLDRLAALVAPRATVATQSTMWSAVWATGTSYVFHICTWIWWRTRSLRPIAG